MTTDKKSDSKKQPMQADGSGTKKGGWDGIATPKTQGRDGKNESARGAYPNPHRGKKPHHGPETFMGHGGQTQIAYHGTGQLGETDVPGEQNDNAPAKNN